MQVPIFRIDQLKNPSRAPAATAEPITPATFGPMACMSRKLWRSYSKPRLLLMRALIGTALTPAFPISGFSFLPFGRKRFISFTKRIPLAEAMMNARAEQPTVKPSSITTMSFRLLPAVLASLVVFPLSFRRFPKKSIPSNGRPDGTMKVVSSKPTIGKRIFSVCDT